MLALVLLVVATSCSVLWSLPQSFNRGLSFGQMEMVRSIENNIAAVSWQARSEWIHHNKYNIIDAFGLDYEEVEEFLRIEMINQHLSQID
jgi:hypothetical protein